MVLILTHDNEEYQTTIVGEVVIVIIVISFLCDFLFLILFLLTVITLSLQKSF
jgi:hypothetical protein